VCGRWGRQFFQIAEEGFETAYKENEDTVTTTDIEDNHILKQALLGNYLEHLTK